MVQVARGELERARRIFFGGAQSRGGRDSRLNAFDECFYRTLDLYERSSYNNGFIIIAWEVTSVLALVEAAVFFVPKYLRMALTTMPQYLECRFDRTTRTLVAFFLLVSFVLTLLPIVYIGVLTPRAFSIYRQG